jgi:hypothetical protein
MFLAVIVARVPLVTNGKSSPIDPEQVRAKDFKLDIGELDDATGCFCPLVAASCSEEVGTLLQKAFWNVERGGEVGLPFIDDDRDSFRKIWQVREAEFR